MKIVSSILFIFVVSFVLNLIWENLHARLYVHYKHGPITEWILIHATLADALFITALGVCFLFIPYLHERLWVSLIAGTVLAIGIEWWALSTDRWAYGPFMPIIPLIHTGLTPTIQLGLLSFGTLYIASLLGLLTL